MTGTTVFHLVRHGQTDWNLTGRWQGHSDVPLNAQGRRQAEHLARRLARDGARFDAFYASDLRRAWETAEIIGRAVGLRPVPTPALREIDLGTWAGKTREEIASGYPGLWERALAGEDIPRGGGETFAALQARVAAWLEGAADRHPGAVICAVTHGGCIRSILLHASGLTWTMREKIQPLSNASVTVVERRLNRWSILRINDEESARPEDGDPA
jgi:probable phosphoglycerate mutase